MKSIIQLMTERGLLDRKELNQVLSSQETTTEPPHKVAIRMGLIAEDTFLRFVRDEFSYCILDDVNGSCQVDGVQNVSPYFMYEHCFFSYINGNDELCVVMNDPFDHIVLENIKKIFPRSSIQTFLAKEEHIKSWIDSTYGLTSGEDQEALEDEEEETESVLVQEDLDQLRDLASEAPIIKKVNQILTKAVEYQASDIHVEPFYDRVLVRFRIDGILKNFDSFSSSIQQAVTTRIKIMAKLDISERRMPQDGRIKIKIAGRNIDLRVSCLPTMYGESMVLRLLDRESISFSLESLGFPDKEKAQFETLINQPYGIILVTGPTGSGKTTTLYSALNTIHSPEKKIITIEDPVEYELDGINQVHVNAKAGLTFAKGLRSIVRQDPDVVLVGEIRDAETAEIAIHAALTGHLVFSTLHTNDSAGAITRLIEMGVEDYLLSSSLIGVLAQRLVRILCPHCKTPFEPDRSLLERFRLSEEALARASFYKPVGCDACAHTGYKGRTALFELLSINDDIRELILKNKSSASIRDMGMRHGMTLLQSDGWWKALNGVTSIEEVIRTTGMA